MAASHTDKPINPLDYLALFSFFFFFIGEVISDQQQWIFQQHKYHLINSNQHRSGSYLSGFIIDGLFKFSRHPNFLCEIFIWWAYYLFSISSSGKILNWTILGPILLTLLIHGSTDFTEEISSEKYPLYTLYQKSTSRLIPWWPSQREREKLLLAIVRLSQKK